MFELFEKAVPVLVEGFWITLRIGLLSILFASLLGLAAALMRTSDRRSVSGLSFIYSTVFRGTPLLIQLFLLYYGIGTLAFVRDQPLLWWLFSDGARCAILAISLNSGAYMSEAIRGGLQSVPSGQIDAAVSCGMNRLQVFTRIRFPLAIRQAFPAYSNELVLAIKGTSLASTIAVMELTGFARRLMSQSYLIVETFIIAGLLYLAINITLLGCAWLVERSLGIRTER
ncbi:ABC transporter permease subunit [Castellaniella sp.]|uniref:ABC transporter permease n=1 Tax=Castellaniella sp. TaxID=1955812 RepID=UPI002AFF9817|nr:ABC transporter permease subunit [Castellaniella sp.]